MMSIQNSVFNEAEFVIYQHSIRNNSATTSQEEVVNKYYYMMRENRRKHGRRSNGIDEVSYSQVQL